MTIRTATGDDLPAVQELWRAFERELPPPEWADVNVERELAEVAEIVRAGHGLVAEQDDRLVGFALGRLKSAHLAHLSDLYVVPEARRHGVAGALVHELAVRFRELGAKWLDLVVLASNAPARAVYARWGFRDEELTLVAPLDNLALRLAGSAAPSFGSIHVQTDDRDAVERAVAQFVPRLPGRSRGSEVSEPRNGWTTVYDDVCDRDTAMLRRLAGELSDRMGAVVIALGVEEEAVVRMVAFERGRIVDEYLSVPEYHGPLPPGDVVAMQANPRVLSRLTGAEPARIRAVARTASAPAELPPAQELLAQLADALGLAGADHGWLGTTG
jgi:ribosomal protein S18 acetylase RimI-like enzyme